MTTLLTDLPPELIIKILYYLPSKDIGQISQTCTYIKEICYSDIIWQRLCHRISQNITCEEWGASYHDIYSEVLCRYGRCIGLWRRNMAPYGGLFQVKVDNGKLIGIEYQPPRVPDIQGALRPKNVFSIGLNKSKDKVDIECLQGYHGPHPGTVIFKEDSMEFKCFKMSNHVHPSGSSAEFEEIVKEETDNYKIPFSSYDKARVQCHTNNIGTYSLLRIAIQPPNPQYPVQPGLFLAHYSSHGIEIFLLSYDWQQKKAYVDKITGDPNVPSGEASIFVNLRRPLTLTREQQTDTEYLMSLNEDDIQEVDEVRLSEQPFEVPYFFAKFPGDMDIDKCQYRCVSQGQIAQTGFFNPETIPGHWIICSDDNFMMMWLEFRRTYLFVRVSLNS